MRGMFMNGDRDRDREKDSNSNRDRSARDGTGPNGPYLQWDIALITRIGRDRTVPHSPLWVRQSDIFYGHEGYILYE